jgi:redox-sensitive bicupin YhaK (pirin superfamily)
VLEGALKHNDSLGTGSVIQPHDVQRMSAGSGVTHSELNPSATEPVHFLQIWLIPTQPGIAPSYEQKRFSPEDKRGRLCVVASPDGRDGSVTIHTDAVVYAGVFEAGERAQLELQPRRHAWVQVARGNVKVNDRDLSAGDGAAISEESQLRIEGVEHGEVLVFDLV